jgi:O-antigen/teichoic acid export membrane protein
VRQGAWVIVGQFISCLGAIALVLLASKVLGPTEYGKLVFYLIPVGFITQFFFGSINNGVLRLYSTAEVAHETKNYVNAVFLLGGLSSVGALLSLVCYYSIQNFSLTSGFTDTLFLCVVWLSITTGFQSLLFNLQIANRNHSYSPIYQSADYILRLVLILIVSQLNIESARLILLAYCLSVTLVLGVQVLNLFSRQTSTITFSGVLTWCHKVWHYSWPFYVWGLFAAAQAYSDRWAVSTFLSFRDVGLYTVTVQIFYAPISILISASSQLLSPFFYAKIERTAQVYRCSAAKVQIISVVSVIGSICLASVVFAVLWGSSLLIFFMGEEYVHMQKYVPWIVLSSSMFGCGQLLQLYFMSLNITKSLLHIKIYTSVLCILLNIVGVQIWGLSGIVASGVIFSAIYLIAISAVLWTHSSIAMNDTSNNEL